MGTDLTQGGSTKVARVAQDHMYVASAVYDATKNPSTAADILEMIHVPKGHMVFCVTSDVLVKESSAGSETLDVGTTDAPGTDVDGFIDGLDLNTLGPSQATIGAYQITSTARPLFFPAAGTIDIKAIVDLDTCKVAIYAVIADMNFVSVP